MDDNTPAAQDHHGGGFANVISGIEHFPKHVIDALHDHSSFLSRLVNSKEAQEIAAYEKTHGREQVAAVEKVGIDAFTAAQATGAHKTVALGEAVKAAFECGLPEVKSLSTLAMHMLLDTALGQLGV